MDENISRAAGASHGQELDEAEFRAIVEPIGRTLAQRTTLYGRTRRPSGRRLRPVRRRRHAERADRDGRSRRADAYRAGPHPRRHRRLSAPPAAVTGTRLRHPGVTHESVRRPRHRQRPRRRAEQRDRRVRRPEWG